LLIVVAVGAVAALVAVIAVRAFRDPQPSAEVRPLLPQVTRFVEHKYRAAKSKGTLVCAIRYLGNSPPKEQFNLYIWEVCGQYHADGGRLVMPSGWSAPAVIWIVKTNNGYAPESEFQSYTDESIPRMFPKNLRRRIYSLETGEGTDSMAAENKRRACTQLLPSSTCKNT